MSEPTSTQASSCYSIEQVATRTGLTKRTLRYYEEMGLLPPAERTEGNYRRYSEEDIQRLERVKELRDLLGFSLSEIREILNVEEERGTIREAFRVETDENAKVAHLDRADELILQQIGLVEQKIAALEQMRASLYTKLERHREKKQVLNHLHNN
ncbi:MerR family transcriptional regulator [Ktedonospora formicarum]|uniref:MerR family transcriptional regulator n=1 Tax=Ktedonospora formicarum TaxID=2778364 RepID=UPI001C6921D6|nr:MerR family transcriptional regulator [Ktedonospora formicarum]